MLTSNEANLERSYLKNSIFYIYYCSRIYDHVNLLSFQAFYFNNKKNYKYLNKRMQKSTIK